MPKTAKEIEEENRKEEEKIKAQNEQKNNTATFSTTPPPPDPAADEKVKKQIAKFTDGSAEDQQEAFKELMDRNNAIRAAYLLARLPDTMVRSFGKTLKEFVTAGNVPANLRTDVVKGNVSLLLMMGFFATLGVTNPAFLVLLVPLALQFSVNLFTGLKRLWHSAILKKKIPDIKKRIREEAEKNPEMRDDLEKVETALDKEKEKLANTLVGAGAGVEIEPGMQNESINRSVNSTTAGPTTSAQSGTSSTASEPAAPRGTNSNSTRTAPATSATPENNDSTRTAKPTNSSSTTLKIQPARSNAVSFGTRPFGGTATPPGRSTTSTADAVAFGSGKKGTEATNARKAGASNERTNENENATNAANFSGRPATRK